MNLHRHLPNRRAIRACALLGAAAVLGSAHLWAQARDTPEWTASWGTALMASSAKASLAIDDFRQLTVRQAMRLSLGGEAVRIRISNRFGLEPLIIGAGTLGRQLEPGGSALVVGTGHILHFAGLPGVTVAPGAEAMSDPVEWPVKAGDLLSVSLYVESGPAQQSVHLAAHATQFIAAGNQSSHEVLEGARPVKSSFQASGIEIRTRAQPKLLVAIGDSVTDGTGSTEDQDERWTDFLVHRLQQAGDAGRPTPVPLTAVVNAGIGGNRMLREGNGPGLLSRFERDVLERPGVTHALVLIGVNDLGRLHRSKDETVQAREGMLAELQSGWRQLAAAAHARGVCLIAGTMTPYRDSRLYQPGPANEVDRQRLNTWLRTTETVDGVADFDAAVRDSGAPERLQASYDSGDHLHLSPAGYRAMAAAVPLDRLGQCRWRQHGNERSPDAPVGQPAATADWVIGRDGYALRAPVT
jgi:lysophospholipase L1-like esterase